MFILKLLFDFFVDCVVCIVGVVFVGGGAVNVNCFGVGVLKIGDCGDVLNMFVLFFVDVGVFMCFIVVFMCNVFVLFLNDVFFFVLFVEVAFMVNVFGGVNRAFSFVFELFGEFIIIGFGDVIGFGDCVGFDVVFFLNFVFNDFVVCGVFEFFRVKFCWFAFRARFGFFFGIVCSLNVFIGFFCFDDVVFCFNFFVNVF